jgi:AraC-like DNA-binding protein
MSQKRRLTTGDEPHFLVRTLAADFADGRALQPHAHPWGQLIFASAGLMHVWTEQGSWVVPPHWALWAPSGVAHAMRFIGATSLRTLYFRPGLGEWPSKSGVVSVSPLLRELILRAIEIGMLDDRDRTHVTMSELIGHEFRARPTPALDLPLPRSERLRQIAEYVAQDPAGDTSHQALSERFGIGVRTLERGFASETGLSLGRWRRQASLLRALRSLGAGVSVKNAATEVGYQSPSAFVAAFRGVFGTTPGRYFAKGL